MMCFRHDVSGVVCGYLLIFSVLKPMGRSPGTSRLPAVCSRVCTSCPTRSSPATQHYHYQFESERRGVIRRPG